MTVDELSWFYVTNTGTWAGSSFQFCNNVQCTCYSDNSVISQGEWSRDGRLLHNDKVLEKIWFIWNVHHTNASISELVLVSKDLWAIFHPFFLWLLIFKEKDKKFLCKYMTWILTLGTKPYSQTACGYLILQIFMTD